MFEPDRLRENTVGQAGVSLVYTSGTTGIHRAG